ncbi:MAG TPA: EAL domain-containing protein [Acidimicrobiales bacterium]|nr:EAL domain-containing protein [Acidimicrobiales bacterium]
MGVTQVDPMLGPGLDRVVTLGSPDLHTVATLDGVYRFVSPAARALFGWEPDDFVSRPQAAFTHPDDVGLVDDARRLVTADPGCTSTTVFRFRCASGIYRWTEAVSRLVDGEDGPLIVSSIRDIGDRKKSEVELRHKASTDPLTGVANRTVFMDRLHQALLRLERKDGLVAVLFLDLDRFKLINDSVGHLAGDAVLLKMAERLSKFLRPQDTLARLGGDEFAVVVEDMSQAEEAVALGRRIVEAGRTPFQVGDERFVCTTSVGIAVTSDARYSAEGLLQEADLALYRAKDRGRDRAEVFDEDLRTRAVGRLGTERMLRRAIAEGRLRLDYQPIVELRTGDTVAVEALVRVWDPDQDHLIEAESFIEVAEEVGLLAQMDEWVLGQAVGQAGAWRGLFAGTAFADVAINVTARHLSDAGFAQSVIADLAAHGLPAAALQVEVTERVLMEASNSAMSGLKVLRDAGVKVGLDDFGTGYSSLSYLRLFPLDFVKIDRSFISELALGATERAIVASIIDLSHALGMAVVAEGVETQAQVEQLMTLGCDRAQGFLFAVPGPPQAIEDRVLTGRRTERK